LVALVDPTLPLDLHPSLTCPNCSRALSRPPRAVLYRGSAAEGRREHRLPVPTAPPHVTGPVPSHAVVGLTIAGIFMLMLIGLFIWFLLNPHSGPGFGALTKP
jgi:hypothetical protein